MEKAKERLTQLTKTKMQPSGAQRGLTSADRGGDVQVAVEELASGKVSFGAGGSQFEGPVLPGWMVFSHVILLFLYLSI